MHLCGVDLESNLRDQIDRFINNECHIEYLTWDNARQIARTIAAVPKGGVYARFIWPARRSVIVKYARGKEQIASQLGPTDLSGLVCSTVGDRLSKSGFEVSGHRGELEVEAHAEVHFRLPDNSINVELIASVKFSVTNTLTGREITTFDKQGNVECLPKYRKREIERLVGELAEAGARELAREITQRAEHHYAIFVFENAHFPDMKNVRSYFEGTEWLEYQISRQEFDHIEIEVFYSRDIRTVVDGLLAYFRARATSLELVRQSASIYVFQLNSSRGGEL